MITECGRGGGVFVGGCPGARCGLLLLAVARADKLAGSPKLDGEECWSVGGFLFIAFGLIYQLELERFGSIACGLFASFLVTPRCD